MYDRAALIGGAELEGSLVEVPTLASAKRLLLCGQTLREFERSGS